MTVVEEDDNDDWVTFAYVAGYTGLMIAWGCAVYGSEPLSTRPTWVGATTPSTIRTCTPTGLARGTTPGRELRRGAAVYGPYGGAGVGARYNPRTGTYARGAAAYGPYGSRSAAQAWNPRTGTYAQSRQGSSVYGSWGSSYVQRGDDWVQSSSEQRTA